MKKVWLVGLVLATALAAVPVAQADQTTFYFDFYGVSTGSTSGISGLGLVSGSGSLLGTSLGGGNYDINGGSNIEFDLLGTTYSATVVSNPTPGTAVNSNLAFFYNDLLNMTSPGYLPNVPDSGVGNPTQVSGVLFLLSGLGSYNGYYLDIWYQAGGDLLSAGDPTGTNYIPVSASDLAYRVNLDVSETPEPSSLLLLGSGLFCMAGFLFWKMRPVVIHNA